MKILIVISLFSLLYTENINHNYLDNQINMSISYFKREYKDYQSELKKNYFEGESKKEISNKINRYLNGKLKNKGEYIVTKCLEVGLDPYLYTSVVLQETGCYWNCSSLVRNCNNVGGNKGNPGCNGGSYKKFDTIEDGINYSIKILNNYYTNRGLKTAKEINKYYASDKTWYVKINNYMNKLKS